MIEAALKGCLKWLTSPGDSTIVGPFSQTYFKGLTFVQEHEQEVMISNLQVWCDRLLGLVFEVRCPLLRVYLAHVMKDPIIKQRVIQLAVGFAIGPLKLNARFALKVFDYILDTKCPPHPTCVTYSDALRDLQAFSLHQLQRLAMRFPDFLVVRRAFRPFCKC